EKKPEVLHGGTVQAIVEIDEVRTGIGPQHVVAMAIAVNAQLAIRTDLVEAGIDGFKQMCRDLFVARDEMRLQPVAGKHVGNRARTELLARQRSPRLETPPAADRVQAAEESAEPFSILARRELGPTPAAALVDRKAITFVLVQRASVVNDRRYDRNLLGRELER